MTDSFVIARPWLRAGLFTLLVGSEQRSLELRAKRTESAPAQQAAPSSRGPQTGQRLQTSRVGSASPVGRSGEAGPVSRPAAGASQAERPQARQKAAAPSLLATPGALPVEDWPASWLALKNRRPLPPHPLVLWTYAGLGDDLTGTPDEVRRQVIVRMLMELRHPGGTHVFWPCGLSGERPQDGPALFWSGVKLLNPRVLLLFGSDARDTLSMPRTLLPFCQERVHGRLVIQLPRPQALAADEDSFKRALAFLASLLSFCAKRRG